MVAIIAILSRKSHCLKIGLTLEIFLKTYATILKTLAITMFNHEKYAIIVK